MQNKIDQLIKSMNQQRINNLELVLDNLINLFENEETSSSDYPRIYIDKSDDSAQFIWDLSENNYKAFVKILNEYGITFECERGFFVFTIKLPNLYDSFRKSFPIKANR